MNIYFIKELRIRKKQLVITSTL